MIGSLKNNELERKWKQSAWCNLWYYRENRLEEIRKVMKIPVEDSRLLVEISTGRKPYTCQRHYFHADKQILFQLKNQNLQRY